jgi:hypothetical protein
MDNQRKIFREDVKRVKFEMRIHELFGPIV